MSSKVRANGNPNTSADGSLRGSPPAWKVPASVVVKRVAPNRTIWMSGMVLGGTVRGDTTDDDKFDGIE